MKLRELLKNIEIISSNADMDMEILDICYDSRKAAPGSLFVAIKGFESDGHRFIPKAKELGASAVLCQDVPELDIPYVQVEDCRMGLAQASRELFGNPASEMTIIGITGTSGKTTSSYLIKHMLETKLNAKVGLIGTNGNLIGNEHIHSEHTTPESYELHKLFRQMKEAGCSHVVMEVSSHSLTLHRVGGMEFDVALYTNLSQDHLDFHKDMEDYAAAKQKIFSMCKKACVNADDKWAKFMVEKAACPVIRFTAEGNEAELCAEDLCLSSDGVRFKTLYSGESAVTKLKIPGHFSVLNAMGVMAVGLSLGLSLEDCADAMSSAEGVKGRLEIVPTDGDYSIIIDYSHKPDALEKVLKILRPITRGRLMCLFGCGGDRDKLKRPIMGKISEELADISIVTSDNPRTEDPMAIIEDITAGMSKKEGLQVICSREDAIRWAIDNAGAGDVILLAGKGHEDYQVVGHEKRHLDEREVVAEHLEKRKNN